MSLLFPADLSFYDSLTYFSPSEFPEPFSMSCQLLAQLDLSRSISNVPYVLSSSLRPDSPSHSVGVAVDILLHHETLSPSQMRLRILSGLLEAGFTRLGLYDLHIHADIAPFLDQDVLWTGISS